MQKVLKLTCLCLEMDKKLAKIESFIDEHHVLSLASKGDEDLSVCSLFYAFDLKTMSFIVASSDDTQHIKNINQNQNIAGNILLETKTVGKIQGLQFKGKFFLLDDLKLKKKYFKTFPYAVAIKPKLWQIKVSCFKMTDNRLGFGKKIICQNLEKFWV